MIEIERTYLAKLIPDLKNSDSKRITDIYFPKNAIHPQVRLRKLGEKFELTKKTPVDLNDSSIQKEQTIVLTQDEFNEFSKLDGKKLEKERYFLDYNGRTAEIDVYLGSLLGLIVIEFEFNSKEEKDSFIKPDFCLIDITQDEFVAAGLLAGKKYSEIQEILDKYGYSKLILQ